MNADRVLDVRGLSVDIQLSSSVLHAVRSVDLTVGRGETLAVVGESGSGKSMTALAIMGLLPPRAVSRADRLVLGDVDLRTITPAAMSSLRGNRIAMVFQDPMTSLDPVYTIGDQLSEVLLRHTSLKRGEVRDRVVDMLERVGIASAARRLGQYPHQLSGGLKQRIMIAMALLCKPDVVIADEPTTALDVTVQAQILRLLVSLQRDLEMGLVLITHDLGVVARIAHRVAVMYGGEVVESGPTQEVFRAPRHPYTRGLLDCVLVPGKLPANSRLDVIPGTVPTLVGELQGCAFYGRCPYGMDHCRKGSIGMEVDGGVAYRCVIPPDRRRRGGHGPHDAH